MLKNYLYSFLLILFIALPASAQTVVDEISQSISQSEVEMHIQFLASDEFKGRDTGTPQLKIAGRYIATRFMNYGVEHVSGMDSYYQPVPFQRVFPPDEGTISIEDSIFVLQEHFVAMNTERGEFEAPVVVLEHGLGSEIDEADLSGRIVIVKAGAPGQVSPQQWFFTANQKNQALKNRGAVAVIELYDNQQLPWQVLTNFLSREQLQVQEETEEQIPHIWLNNTDKGLHNAFARMESATGSIKVKGKSSQSITSNNVVGFIEGSDPELKNEYILLGAHYDHVGVVDGQTEGNYIYNGARDNAVGTAAIMLAARYLAKNPPKRSVLFAAWTAEEKGLLGSNWFAENSPVPLNQIVYNLNIDGAGYNDTTKVTVIGLERTTAEEDLRYAAESFGLEAIPDPVPEQNLFDRSDNVNFARHGIPAPTYSLGITAFDDEINKYYHTVEDEPHTLNYSYITSYIRSFVLASLTVSNAEQTPFWREGDVYEEAGLELYGLTVEQ